MPKDELCAGGHVLSQQTLADLSALDAKALIAVAAPARALVIGRDGMGPDGALLEALRSAGTKVGIDPGHGWGAALARPQSLSPKAVFETVNRWLAEPASDVPRLHQPKAKGFHEIGAPGARVRETPIVFERAGQQLYAIVSQPLDSPVADGTIIMFNAGAIRRIGPNRIWTEAARRWAAAGDSGHSGRHRRDRRCGRRRRQICRGRRSLLHAKPCRTGARRAGACRGIGTAGPLRARRPVFWSLLVVRARSLRSARAGHHDAQSAIAGLRRGR